MTSRIDAPSLEDIVEWTLSWGGEIHFGRDGRIDPVTFENKFGPCWAKFLAHGKSQTLMGRTWEDLRLCIANSRERIFVGFNMPPMGARR